MKKQGFTILEILVVLAVLAILIGIAVPRIKGMQDLVKIIKAQSELKTIQTALQAYYISKNPHAYPEADDDSFFHLTENILMPQKPQIISGIIYDAFVSEAGIEYGYQLSSNGQYYVVYSRGPNGEAEDLNIQEDGEVVAKDEDDICVTNGSGC